MPPTATATTAAITPRRRGHGLGSRSSPWLMTSSSIAAPPDQSDLYTYDTWLGGDGIGGGHQEALLVGDARPDFLNSGAAAERGEFRRHCPSAANTMSASTQ